jgi:hypothetical protein
MLVCADKRALDQMDWIEKITGIIASFLSSQIPKIVIIVVLFLILYSYIFLVC